MMSLSHGLANALTRIHEIVQRQQGIHIIHTNEIKRADRELLMQTGWLEEIILGWYMLVRPDAIRGNSTAWYANFWDFLKLYLHHRFNTNYCLSAECSLDLHTGSSNIPKQVIVMGQKGSGSPIKLPFDTSILIYLAEIPDEKETIHGIQAMSLPYALCKITPTYFQANPQDAQIALLSLVDPNDLVRTIVQYDFKSAARRLIGGYNFIGQEAFAQTIQHNLAEVGMFVSPINPFEQEQPLTSNLHLHSPKAIRIQVMWEKMRQEVIAHFPEPPKKVMSVDEQLEKLTELYTQDAYHSLSIEGYQVTEQLIEKVRTAKWDPDHNLSDKDQHNALAARGYYEAFLAVKKSVKDILEDGNPGAIIKRDLSVWFQKLFGPSARAGLFPQSDLFGYRRNQVYIRNSRHTPPAKEALTDCMEAFFYCLAKEENPAVRAVLGHFIFVYIHPYMDGNGRISRFLMNAMLLSGGYPWTVIHVQNRNAYFEALEAASVDGTIIPFTKFLTGF